MDKPQWIVVNIGCIECGVSSGIVGVFADKARADGVASMCETYHNWRGGGQNAYGVYQLPEPEIVAPDYALGED